ncbi:MAG: hypothetical protein AB7Q69_05825 [Gemmatimonadales bacterium]
MGPGSRDFLAAMAVLVAATVTLWPLVRALARRIERGPALAGRAEDLDELRERVAELETRQAAVTELEERLDFAERRLSRQSEAGRLPR